jgi:hypothetical protein
MGMAAASGERGGALALHMRNNAPRALSLGSRGAFRVTVTGMAPRAPRMRASHEHGARFGSL